MCGTTMATTGDDDTPTSGGDDDTGTGDSSSESTASSESTDAATETTSTTASPDEAPLIISRVVMPSYTAVNALLTATATAENAHGVRMQIDHGPPVDLSPLGSGEFAGPIAAFTAFDNKQHTATFTPWRDMVVGAAVDATYVIALPPPGYEVSWQTDSLDIDGQIAAIAVLPDGSPVELGTFKEMGESRCYLRLRDKAGVAHDLTPVLPNAYCKAVDLTIDRTTGVLRVLVERNSAADPIWSVGEAPGWGTGPNEIASGKIGDIALALAASPGLVAVCGARPTGKSDKRDALTVLLRPNQPAEEQVFDYQPGLPKHQFADTARDCAFWGDTLVLVGEANGRHSDDDPNIPRDRLVILEHNVATSQTAWIVSGPELGLQSRALGLAVDLDGNYHLAGYTCLDFCTPEGDYRVYAPGGELLSQTSFALGSAWFGPHAIAWNPAGYAVIAMGEMQGPLSVFKVQAFAPDVPLPLWTFRPNDKQEAQLALALAVGPYGEIYAGGLGSESHPAFAVIGG